MAEYYRRIVLGPDILAKAEAKARLIPDIAGSHRRLQARIVGCIGEAVYEDFMTSQGVVLKDETDQYTHDFRAGAYTIDVKTKDRTCLPRSDFDNSVPVSQTAHQRPDLYHFVSLMRDRHAPVDDIMRFKEAHILGGIDLQTLERQGQLWEAGETDPSNNVKFWTDCINVSMDQLINNHEIVRMLYDQQ